MRRRIVFSLGVLLTLCLLGGAIALLCLDRSIRQLGAVGESNRIQSMRTDLASIGVRIETDLMAHLAGYQRSPEERRDHARQFRDSLARCERCHHEPSVQGALDGVRDTFLAYQEVAERFFVGGNAQGVVELQPQVVQLSSQLVEQTTGLADQAARHLDVRNADAAASVRNAWRALTGTLAVVLVVGGLVAVDLKRRLTKPVDALLAGIERIRQGDSGYRFALDADEEFRVLGNAFNQAYQSLTSAQEAVLQAEKMAAVGKLAAGVAHEVGNPLASISSITQMMQRACDDETEAERLGLIMAEIARINRIVRHLLEFSRSAPGERRDQVDLGTLLEHANTLLGYDKRSANVRTTIRCDADLPAVRGDADRLLLVFTNIMMNAFDAVSSREGGKGTLNISAECEDRQVVLRFEDNGPGMTEEELAKAFEPFFTTKAPGDGTGLGLWICYEVVQKHEGTIRLASSHGQGSTVIIKLPSEPILRPDDSRSEAEHALPA
ncbi:MAG: sensor histidine kinase [Planctomycetota bacterium]|jgi:signal transduction histidine kinase